MTDLETRTKVYEPDELKYAAAAAQFLQTKDIISARKCLDNLAKSLNPTIDDEALKGYVWNAYGDDPKAMASGIQRGVEIYSSDYAEALGNKTMNEMFERYAPELNENLTEQERAKAKEAFAKLGDKKYTDILEEITLLKEVMDSKTKRYSKEEKAKAKKDFEEKYAPVITTIQGYENLRISELMPDVKKETVYAGIKEYFKVEEEELAEAA